MIKKKRNHNPNLVKEKHSYTFAEISEDLNIHPRTVQNWHKLGLKVLDETSRPYLVYGEELKHFLKAKRQDQKHQLKQVSFSVLSANAQEKVALKTILLKLPPKNLERHLGRHLSEESARCVISPYFFFPRIERYWNLK
jgi:DNA-binding transcriptional MerR regulator